MRVLICTIIAILFATTLCMASQTNDISFWTYKDFQNKWKLVTVRYRMDSKEQRFTYANDSAYATLISGNINYKDGAVFAKISMSTGDDPDFDSSKVPLEIDRIQFMVRDKVKYAATNGWGYAVYSPGVDRIPIDSQNCSACHAAVKHRAYIFSQPMFSLKTIVNKKNKSAFDTVDFVDYSSADAPKNIRDVLPPDIKTIRFLAGSLRHRVFGGTLDELRPMLINESARTNKASLFLAFDSSQFVLVVPDKTAGCSGEQKAYLAYFDTTNPAHVCQ